MDYKKELNRLLEAATNLLREFNFYADGSAEVCTSSKWVGVHGDTERAARDLSVVCGEIREMLNGRVVADPLKSLLSEMERLEGEFARFKKEVTNELDGLERKFFYTLERHEREKHLTASQGRRL